MGRKVYVSDSIVGGSVGLAGFYSGYSRETTICFAMVAIGLSILVQYLYRRKRLNDC
jgi:hypothetical protein